MAENDSKKPTRTERGSPPQSEPSSEAKMGLIQSGGKVAEGKEAPNDPFESLDADYQEAKRLFEEYEKAAHFTQKSKLVEKICDSIIVHSTLEEEIFYPACRELVDDEKLDEAQVESDSAKTLVNELLQGSPRDAFFDSKVKVLAEQFRTHIEHERNWAQGLFVTSKSDGASGQAVAGKLRSRRKELISLAQAGSLPPVKLVALSHLTGIRDQKEEPMGQVYRDGREQSRNYDDDRRRSHSRGESEDYRARSRNTPERDEQGRFLSEEESRRSRGRGYGEDEDYRGHRYASDEDRRSSRGRSDEDDDRSYRGRSGQNAPSRDDQGRFMSDDDRRYGANQSRQNDDDHRQSREGHGGWSGDPRGHSEAARRGWENREGYSRDGRDNDERRYSDSGESGGRGHGGWFGDPEGHAQAARRGWDERENDNRSSRSPRDDEEDRRTTRSSSRGGHGGWFGDPEGHSEASRRGWEDRR